MKIVMSDKVYVQRNDLAYLMKSCEGKEIPASVINKVFSTIFICNESNRYEFLEFSDPIEIEFFKNLEYSVDYMELRDKCIDEIIELGVSISEKMNEIAKKFNELDEIEKAKNLNLIDEHELLEFKMYSLRDVAWLKQGKLKMKLPKDAKEPNMIQRFFKKLQRR